MKTTIILILFVLGITSINGQYPDRKTPPDAIYLSYQPYDHGLGLRYDHHFNVVGMYGSASYGSSAFYKIAGMKNHVKLTLGALVPLKDWRGNQHDVSIGLNRHYVDTFETDDVRFNNTNITKYPWSFEVGLTVKYKRITLGMRTDILHWEPCIDIGIPFH